MKSSSGNVFADLGFPDADLHLVKAGLVVKIDSLIRHKGITRESAAEAIGIGTTKLSEILVGHFRDCSVHQLMSYLVALGVDVEIVVKPKAQETAQLRVA